MSKPAPVIPPHVRVCSKCNTPREKRLPWCECGNPEFGMIELADSPDESWFLCPVCRKSWDAGLAGHDEDVACDACGSPVILWQPAPVYGQLPLFE